MKKGSFVFDAYKNADRATAPEYGAAYREAFCLAPTVPNVCECSVEDYKEKHLDLDGSPMNVHVGSYTMGPDRSDCLIKKPTSKPAEEKAITFSSYNVLKKLRHHNIVTIENFFDVQGHPRFVLSWIDGTIKAWLQKTENQKKFFGTTMGRPSSWFRQMALEISSALEYLFDKGICPSENCLNDIFFCTAGARLCPKLLISEVTNLSEEPAASEAMKNKIWDRARDMLLEIAQCQDSKISPATEKFCKYIGKGTTLMLREYPDAWTNCKKTCYLLSVISGNADDVRRNLPTDLKWPKAKSGDVHPVLKAVITYEANKTVDPVTYDVLDPYSYLEACRNILKHWFLLCKMVPYLKSFCSDRDGFIRMMESWDRNIWFKVYEAVGWPGCY